MVNPHDTILRNVKSCLGQKMSVSDPLTDPNFLPRPQTSSRKLFKYPIFAFQCSFWMVNIFTNTSLLSYLKWRNAFYMLFKSRNKMKRKFKSDRLLFLFQHVTRNTYFLWPYEKRSIFPCTHVFEEKRVLTLIANCLFSMHNNGN